MRTLNTTIATRAEAPAAPTSDRSIDRLLLTIPEAGRMLGVGRSMVYSLIWAKQLPVIKIGAAARIPARAVREWAENAEAAAREDR